MSRRESTEPFNVLNVVRIKLKDSFIGRQSVHDLAAESVRKHHRGQKHRVLTVMFEFLKIRVGLLHSMARFLAARGWLRSNCGNWTMKRTRWTLLEMRSGQAPLVTALLRQRRRGHPSVGKEDLNVLPPNLLEASPEQHQEITASRPTPPYRHTKQLWQLHFVASVAPDWARLHLLPRLFQVFISPHINRGQPRLVYHVFVDECAQCALVVVCLEERFCRLFQLSIERL